MSSKVPGKKGSEKTRWDKYSLLMHPDMTRKIDEICHLRQGLTPSALIREILESQLDLVIEQARGEESDLNPSGQLLLSLSPAVQSAVHQACDIWGMSAEALVQMTLLENLATVIRRGKELMLCIEPEHSSDGNHENSEPGAKKR